MVDLSIRGYLKKIAALGIVLTISAVTFAQDVIVKKNAEEIEARVIRIGETSITYKNTLISTDRNM